VNTALVTIFLKPHGDEMSRFSKPFFNYYANKIKSTPIIITTERFGGEITQIHGLEKYQLYDILNSYDRVMYVDGDTIIHPNTQNIFDIVPESHIGAVFDNKNNIQEMDSNDWHDNIHIDEIQRIQDLMGNIGWTDIYINCGVLVLSKMHRNIFLNHHILDQFQTRWQDQTVINYHIQKYGHQIYRLETKYNKMTLNGLDLDHPDDANILHFAGYIPTDRFNNMSNIYDKLEPYLRSDSLWNSKNWRITRPLRNLARRLKGLPAEKKQK
jgi:lipopolysaccharide biosynthesis glycosyltransferase